MLMDEMAGVESVNGDEPLSVRGYACVQNYGFEEGIPFTLFWKGMRAQRVVEAFLTDKIEEALQDREALAARKSVVSLLMEGFDDEEGGHAFASSDRCEGAPSCCAHEHRIYLAR